MDGSRQGGILSPYVFTRYVRGILTAANSCNTGYNVGGLFLSLLAYADDMVLLAPSWDALQKLLDLLDTCCNELDILCNTKKTVCMMFKPKDRKKIVSENFPCLNSWDTSLMINSMIMMTLIEKSAPCLFTLTCLYSTFCNAQNMLKLLFRTHCLFICGIITH